MFSVSIGTQRGMTWFLRQLLLFYFNYLFQKSKILKTKATLRLQTESILNFYDFKRLIHSTKELPSHLQIFESYLYPFPPGWILPDEEQSRWRDLGRWSAYESSHQLIDALSPTTVSLLLRSMVSFRSLSYMHTVWRLASLPFHQQLGRSSPGQCTVPGYGRATCRALSGKILTLVPVDLVTLL